MFLTQVCFTNTAFVSLDEFWGNEHSPAPASQVPDNFRLRQKKLLPSNFSIIAGRSHLVNLFNRQIQSGWMAFSVENRKTAGAVISYDPNFREKPLAGC